MANASVSRMSFFSLIAIVGACTPPIPPSHIGPAEAVIHRSFEQIWPSVVGFFANNTIPIETVDRSSGLIVSRPLELSDAQRKLWIDCGKMSGIQRQTLQANLSVQTSFNVFLRPAGDSTLVRVNISVSAQAYALGQEGRAPADCASNGVFERELLASLNGS